MIHEELENLLPPLRRIQPTDETIHQLLGLSKIIKQMEIIIGMKIGEYWIDKERLKEKQRPLSFSYNREPFENLKRQRYDIP